MRRITASGRTGGGGDGDVARSLLVEPKGEVALFLAVVDARHRGAMDDDIGMGRDGFLGKRVGVGDVPLRQVGDDDLVVGEGALERAPEHSLAASDENLHLPAFSLRRANSRTMLAPRRTICQLM